jgi:ElaB/YqjD/DUF883 family membrane-anchored ribosome-binding protein
MNNGFAHEIVDELSEAVARAARRMAAQSKHMSQAAERAVGRGAEAVEDFLEEAGHDAKLRTQKLAREAIRETREHPAIAIAAGAAVGVLAAVLLMRGAHRGT